MSASATCCSPGPSNGVRCGRSTADCAGEGPRRRGPVELIQGDPRERARWLADRTGTDPTAVWEWGVVERVSTGLLAMSIEMDELGREMLALADRIADAFRDARGAESS